MSEYPGYTSPNAPQEDPAPPAAPPEPKQRNTVGLIALITAIVGFIFACIPGALIVGWILLPIAFILSIVGLVQSGKPKGSSIAAIILSVVGFIVGVLVFMFVVGSAIDDAFSGSTPEITQPEEGEEQPDEGDEQADAGEEQPDAGEVPAETETESAEGGDDAQESPSGAEGTRSDPAALGSTLSGEEWDVTVVGFEPDATDRVLETNQFNEEPESGNTYALAEVEATYTGEESGHPWLDLTLVYVTESGNTVNSYDSMAVTPDPQFNEIGELYEGASGTGYVLFEIPEGDGGLLRVSMGLFGEDVFVATQ